MKLIQTLLSLVALTFFGATATPTDVTPRTDRPISLSREAIPVGATVYGLDGNSDKDGDGPFNEITKRDYCNDGSLACPFVNKNFRPYCRVATNMYDDNAWYCGYATRASKPCIAKFSCKDYHGNCWAGWFLKQKFLGIPCLGCGSNYFDNENCRTTYDYCVKCKNVG